MIKFICKKCGYKIEVANKYAGEMTKCHNCLREQSVPLPFYQKMRNAREEPIDIEPYAVKPLEQTPTQDLPFEKEQSPIGRIEDYADEPDDGFLNSISLQFSEASLFAMSLVFLILFAIDKPMREDLLIFVRGVCGGTLWMKIAGIICILLPFVLGLGLSVFHALSTKEKGFFDKAVMLFFAVAICAGTGLYMGIYILMGELNLWLIIFALCNLIYCALLIFKFELTVIEDDLDGNHISDRDADITEIIFTVLTALAVLYACRHIFNFHWVITYSICITYITAINTGISGLLKGRW